MQFQEFVSHMDLAESFTFVNFTGTLAILFTVAVFLSGM